jgi:hypothetical protein
MSTRVTGLFTALRGFFGLGGLFWEGAPLENPSH